MGALALLLVWTGPVCAINFALGAGEERCISETLMPKALLTGGWRFTGTAPSGNPSASSEASPPPSPPLPPATPALALNTTMRVLSVSGATLFESPAGAGHFSVTAVDNGEHRICVRADGGAVHASLDVKTAVEVADHTLAARPEHVAAVEAEVERMEELAKHVHQEMVTMRRRADEADALDSSIRGRLVWVEIGMMCTLLLMGLWQINYLKNFFQAKKLI